MKDIINGLLLNVRSLDSMNSTFDRDGLEHGSPDQTRAMMIESIFNQAIGNIQVAIKQLEILDRELY